MAVARTKYSMQVRIRYKGNLVDALDRIRAIRLVLMVQDLGKGAELVTVKIMTPYPPRQSFHAIRKLCIGKIETLEEMQLLETTLTKLQ